jgi:hypothetical protein
MQDVEWKLLSGGQSLGKSDATDEPPMSRPVTGETGWDAEYGDVSDLALPVTLSRAGIESWK